jgi:hypothetical protein
MLILKQFLTLQAHTTDIKKWQIYQPFMKYLIEIENFKMMETD